MNWFCSLRSSSNRHEDAPMTSSFINNRLRPQYSYFAGPRRKVTKRRGVSPKIFPRKILVTEEKVAADLCRLRISAKKRYRTLAEIEASLDTDSDEESDDDESRVVISDELKKQINDFKRNLLMKNPQNKLQSVLNEPSTSAALVLWKPPSGVVENVMQKVRSSYLDTSSDHPNPQTANHDIQMGDDGSSSRNLNPSPDTKSGGTVFESSLPRQTVLGFSVPSSNNFIDIDDDDMMEL